MNGKTFISNAILLLLFGCGSHVSLSQTSVATDSTSTINVGGSSETYGLLAHLIEAYQPESNDVSFDFLPPSQTSGGIQGVESKLLDIGGVSSLLTAQDIETEIRYVQLAHTPLVVVIHNSVTGINDISGEQIKDIYSGQIINWSVLDGPDAEITVFDFTEDENEK
ncbi:MAG: substrate-binding domain-containing protein, partial [Cyanobacteria bacterium J06642_11]